MTALARNTFPPLRSAATSKTGARVLAGLFAVALGLAVAMGVPPMLLGGGLATVVAFVVATRRLEALVLLTVFAFILPSLNVAAGAEWAMSLRWALQGLLLVALVTRVPASQVLRRVRARLPVSLLLFLGLAAMSAAWSIEPRLTWGRAATFVAMIAILALVYTIEDAPRQVANAMRLIGAVLALGGLTMIRFDEVASSRYAGLFANPNTLGVAAALLFPFALERALNSRIGWVRVANGLVAALLVGQAAAAASRGGILAIMAAYVYLGGSHFRKSRSRTRFVVLMLPAVLAVAASLTVVDPQRLSLVNSRTSLWGLFPQVFWERPIFGHGFGTTQIALAPFSSITGYYDPRGVDFHNSYFNLLSDLGIFGGIILALFIFRAIQRRRLTQPALTSVALAGLTSAIFESWLFSVGSGVSFVFWFAVVGMAVGNHDRAPHARGAT